MEEIIKGNNEFVVIDIETSHFHPNKGAMIIELAAVKIKDGKIIDKRTQLIDPERKITEKITEVTGITNDMLVGKPKFRQVLPSFYDFLGNATVVAHNASFDWNRFLLHFLRKVGIYPKNDVVDTLALSKKYIDSKDGYSLGTLCEKININLTGAHRALNDAMATAELFLYIKENYIDSSDSIQITLEDNIKKPEAKSQNVRKVAFYDKQVNKNKLLQRIYVTLDRAVVFFDIPTKAWEVKASNEPIDLEEVEGDVLKYLQLNNVEELINHYTNIKGEVLC